MRITPANGSSQRRGNTFGSRVVQADFEPADARLEFREDANTLDCHERGSTDFDLADDAVPVALCLLRDRMRCRAKIDLECVVDADGDAVGSGRKPGSEVVDVRYGEAVL